MNLKLYFFISMFLCMSCASLLGQIKTFTQCNSYEKPLFLHKGDTVISLCDTAILINTIRYNLYESARQTILTNKYSKLQDEMNSALTEQIGLYKLWNDSLQTQYTRVSGMFASSLNNTQRELIKVSGEITTAKDSLNKANENLNSALSHLNKARWEKYKWGGAGLLIGILGTSVIMLAL